MSNNFGLKLALKLPVIGYKLKQEHFNLLTETGEELLAEDGDAWQAYPRPQMRREEYHILNGTWLLNGKSIRMPFPPQAFLSGFSGRVDKQLTYNKEFTIPSSFKKERILLHFGAVDQIARVYINGKEVGYHEGGYLPFSCDITKAVKEGSNILMVKVTDTLSQDYPYGKQKKKRGGMWYTPVSGIWQTVWLENVSECYITNVKLTPDLCGVDIEINTSECVHTGYTRKDEVNDSKFLEINGENDRYVTSSEAEGFSIEVTLENGQKIQRQFEGTCGRLDMAQIKMADGTFYKPLLWTPENPH